MQNALYLSLGVSLLLAIGGFAWLSFGRARRAPAGSPGRFKDATTPQETRRTGKVPPSPRDIDPAIVVPIRSQQHPDGLDTAPGERSDVSATSSPDASLRLTATSGVAGTDAITGLPNRAKFLEEFELRLETLRRSRESHCIAMVRIDRFSDIRTERGMRASELVLALTAERLQETMRDGDIVARFDRDTFVLSLADLSAKDAPGAVERLRRSACQEIEIEGALPVVVTASSSFAAVDPDSEAGQLVACCRGALAMARSEESLAVS